MSADRFVRVVDSAAGQSNKIQFPLMVVTPAVFFAA
jgi:hypothetical protein